MSEGEKRQIGGRESEAEEDRLIKSFQTEDIEEMCRYKEREK